MKKPQWEKEKPEEFESCESGANQEWEIYKDNVGEWRWWKKALIDEIVTSSEGYGNKADCIADAQRHGMDCEPS